jgi:predicted glycosyltransferase
MFCDSPHANAVMRLTLPLIQKLLIPHIIPKKEFSKFGIQKKDIITYKAIDASVTIKRKINEKIKLPFKKNKKKNILIRLEEEEAAYALKSKKIIPIIKKILETFEEVNIVILSRYTIQIEKFEKEFNKRIEIIKMTYDGKYLLKNTNIFIGSGGTMTAESALLGIPTISYNAVPNIVENYLVRKNLIKREINPDKICNYIKKIFKESNKKNRNNAEKIRSEMEDPIQKLIKIIEE